MYPAFLFIITWEEKKLLFERTKTIKTQSEMDAAPLSINGLFSLSTTTPSSALNTAIAIQETNVGP